MSRNNLSLSIWQNLFKAYHILNRVNQKRLYHEKLTVPQFRTLLTLNIFGAIPLKKISENLMVTGANITCVVDNLEKEGLVIRVPSKIDRRVIDTGLTPKGEKVIRETLPFYLEDLNNTMANLNEDEQKTLITLLAKLIN